MITTIGFQQYNRTDSIFDADPLDSELRILDWNLFHVCSNEIKKI